MRISLPSLKLDSSPARHICRIFSDEQAQRLASVSGEKGRAAFIERPLAPIEAFGRDAQRLDPEGTKAGNSSK